VRIKETKNNINDSINDFCSSEDIGFYLSINGAILSYSFEETGISLSGKEVTAGEM